MNNKAKNQVPISIAADPNQWSDQSKQSVAFQFNFIREYVDKAYECHRCGTTCVFTAADQKYTFEIKKASIDQRRKLCAACWSASHVLKINLAERDVRWTEAKDELRTDREFLAGWLKLLTEWADFAPYKQDVAKINMLRGLLDLE